MQVMQMDPRFMKVFQVLTGIDLAAMGEAQAKKEANDEEIAKREEAEE